MVDVSQIAYDFQHDRLVWGGEAMIMHCHHYNCFLQRSIQDAEYIDSAPFLVGAAAEVAYGQLRQVLADAADVGARKSAVEKLYRTCGFGLIDLSAVTERGGEVRTRSTHYSTGWREKFGRSAGPVAFFSTGFLAGALAAIYGLELGSVQAKQVQCRSTGAEEDVFVLGRGASNFTTFEPRGKPELLPIGQQAEPETPVNREGITQAVVGMPLAGNAQGMIPAFGVYLTRMYADYYNRISFAFERELIGVSGRTGIEVASGLFIEAGHVCAFNTMGGIMTSAEWDGLVLPMLKTRQDWLYGIVACVNALGWGTWKVLDVTDSTATFRVYNDYESVGYRSMYGTADHGISYLATGAAAGLMNLIYVGDIHNKPALTPAFYDRLFKAPGVFRAKMNRCMAMGDPYTEIRVVRDAPALRAADSTVTSDSA